MRRSGPPRRKTGLRRSGKPKPKTRKLSGIGLDKENRALFQDAARRQGVCGMCGKGGRDHQAHHVVYEQHLRDFGLPVYDGRNAMRLCERCHGRHHARYRVIPTKLLPAVAIEYGFDVFGAAAADYFRRYYDDRDPDPRIVTHWQALSA